MVPLQCIGRTAASAVGGLVGARLLVDRELKRQEAAQPPLHARMRKPAISAWKEAGVMAETPAPRRERLSKMGLV